MSEVASLELCRELYELSGWGLPQPELLHYWHNDELELAVTALDKYDQHEPECIIYPAYTIGFILRKLPKIIAVEKDIATFVLGTTSDFGQLWIADYELVRANTTYPNTECIGEADTPEDAATKLAIELIKQNIITPEQAGEVK